MRKRRKVEKSRERERVRERADQGGSEFRTSKRREI